MCKAWEGAVNTYLDTHPSRRPFNETSSVAEIRRKTIPDLVQAQQGYRPSPYFFTKTRALRRLQAELKPNGSRCPIIGKAVSLTSNDGDIEDESSEEDDVQEEEEEFWSHVASKFLPSYGSQLWHAVIIPPKRFPAPSLVSLTRDMLWSCPNLRSLNIRAIADESDGRQELERRPLPALSHFDTLIASEWHGKLPSYLARKLLSKYGAQLGRLELKISEHDFLEGVNFQGNMTNLTDLYMNIASLRVLTELLENLKASSNPRLHRLRLELCTSRKQETLEIVKRLWTVIGSFGETLRALVLITNEDFLAPLDSVPLVAPHLEYLELACSTNTSLGFLSSIGLPSIQYFHLDIGFYAKADSPQSRSSYESEELNIHSFMHDGDIYKSNMWKMWPKLKQVAFEFQPDMFGCRRKEKHSRVNYDPK